VVVAAVQPKVPPDLDPLLRKLEVIPLRPVQGGSSLDLEAVLRRHPAVCFIDGLAYNNPPGSRNPTRWEDVQQILSAGIKVVTSINIQYITELRERAEAITGKQVRDTVPVSFLKGADEVEIVDAPAEDERPDTGRRQQLSKLRELALVLAADVVDHQLEQYLEQHGVEQHFGTLERILVCLTPRSNAREMIEAAKTIAEKFHGELIAAYVNQPEIAPSDRAALNERLEIALAAGSHIEILEGDDPVSAILDFARSRGITQLFIGHSQRSGLRARLWGNPVDKLIEQSRGMDVRIFPQ
jgi:two-component system sensor histidine kinase KdpD